MNELLGQLRRVGILFSERYTEEIWALSKQQVYRYAWKKTIYDDSRQFWCLKTVMIYWNGVYHHFKQSNCLVQWPKSLDYFEALSLVKVVASDGDHDNDSYDDK